MSTVTPESGTLSRSGLGTHSPARDHLGSVLPSSWRSGVVGRMWKGIRPSIPLSSISQYYGVMRLVGYVYELIYKDITHGLTADVQSPTLDFLQRRGIVKESGKFSDSFEKVFHTFEEARARKITNILEAGTFLSLTVITALGDRKKLLADFAEAEAASRGTTPEKIGLWQLIRSKNPIIDSAMDRFTFQNFFRVVSDLAFARSLKAGILLKSFDITLERSAFVDKDSIAYDKIKAMVQDVQGNNFGDTIKRDTMHKLIASYQSAKRDHLDEVIHQEQTIALEPAFEAIADALIQQKISTSGVVYLLGGGAIVPENAELSLKNVERYISDCSKKIASETQPSVTAEPRLAERDESLAANQNAPDATESVTQRLRGRVKLQPTKNYQEAVTHDRDAMEAAR